MTPVSPNPPLPAAYRAIACGADVNHAYTSQPAAQLVWEANMQVRAALLGGWNMMHTVLPHF